MKKSGKREKSSALRVAVERKSLNNLTSQLLAFSKRLGQTTPIAQNSGQYPTSRLRQT